MAVFALEDSNGAQLDCNYVCPFFVPLSPLAKILVPKPGESQQASHWSSVLFIA